MSLITRRGGALLGAGALAAGALPRGAAAQTQAAPTAAAPGNPGFHRFRIGGFTVTTLFDGTARLNLEGFVANASVAEVQAVLAESFLPTDHYLTPYTVTVNAAVVPEPSTYALLCIGLGAAGYARKKTLSRRARRLVDKDRCLLEL